VPRKLRIEYPGAIYHVMSRGNQRQDIVRDAADRQRFLETLGQACAKTGWQAHAWCLMRNHFHLVIETPQPNLVAGMKWLVLDGDAPKIWFGSFKIDQSNKTLRIYADGRLLGSYSWDRRLFSGQNGQAFSPGLTLTEMSSQYPWVDDYK
jgi:hypothetical protein